MKGTGFSCCGYYAFSGDCNVDPGSEPGRLGKKTENPAHYQIHDCNYCDHPTDYCNFFHKTTFLLCFNLFPVPFRQVGMDPDPLGFLFTGAASNNYFNIRSLPVKKETALTTTKSRGHDKQKHPLRLTNWSLTTTCNLLRADHVCDTGTCLGKVKNKK